MKVKSYRDLKVWQKAIVLTKQIYIISKSFPKEEIYGLTSQIRRAAVSIASNIAEGHARTSLKEFLNFLSITLGSLAELETQLIIATELNYLTNGKLQSLLAETDELGKMLRGLQNSLNEKKKESKIITLVPRT